MIGTTKPAYARSYSIVSCRNSGGKLVERLLGRHSASGPGRVVHVIRDGRDAAAEAFDALPPGHSVAFDEYAAAVAHHWVSFVENVRMASEGHDGRYLELRYEALVGDPAGEITRLLDFLRIDASADTVCACRDRVRLDAATVGIWRHRFDDEAAFRFDAVAGYLLQDLGYIEPTTRGLARAA